MPKKLPKWKLDEKLQSFAHMQTQQADMNGPEQAQCVQTALSDRSLDLATICNEVLSAASIKKCHIYLSIFKNDVTFHSIDVFA